MLQVVALAVLATAARAAHTRIAVTAVALGTTTGVSSDNAQLTNSCSSSQMLVGCMGRNSAHRSCDAGRAINDKDCLAQASGRGGTCYPDKKCATFPSDVTAALTLVEVRVDGDDAVGTASCPTGSILTGVGWHSGSAVTDGVYPNSGLQSITAIDGDSASETYGYGYCYSGLPLRGSTRVSGSTSSTAGASVTVSCPDPTDTTNYKITGAGVHGIARNCRWPLFDISNAQKLTAYTTLSYPCNVYIICHDFYGCGDSILDHDDNAEECDSTDSSVCNSCLYAPPPLTLTGYYNEIAVEWTSPCDGQPSTQCETPTGYQIEWRLSGSTTASHVQISSGSTLSTVLSSSSLSPGTTYEVRIKALSAHDPYSASSSGLEDKFTAWTSVTTSCDCEDDLDRNGEPHSFTIEQVVDQLFFTFAEPNACNEQVTLSRYPTSDPTNIAEIGTVVDTVAKCTSTSATQSSLTMFTSELDIGVDYTFVVDVASSVQVTGVTATTTFVSEFVGNIQIVVQAESGLVLSGALVEIYEDASSTFLGSAVIDAAAPSLVAGTDVTIEADFAADGVTLTLQTPAYAVESLTLRAEVSQTTSGLVHDFRCVSTGSACSSDTVTVTHLAAASSILFVDLAVFTVSGTVVLDGTDSLCGTEGVQVCLTDTSIGEESCTATDASGAYTLSAVVGAPVSIAASLSGHTIELASGSESEFTLGADTVVDFLDTTTAELTLSLGGGECLIYLGEWTAAAVAANCGSFSVQESVGTTAGVVSATVTVPAQPYAVGRATDPSGLPNGVFAADEIVVDLASSSSGEARFVYNKELDPATDIVVSPGGPVSASCPDVVIGRQAEAVNVTVQAVARFDNGECSDLSGTVTFFDRAAADTADCADFGTDAGCSKTLVSDGSSSMVVFESIPEYPQVLESENFLWEQKVEVLLDGFVTPVEYYWSVLVIGHKPVGDAFTMQFPSYIPLLVLHDPPGGGSYSEFTSSTTVTTDIALTLSSSDGVGSLASFVLGYEDETSVCAGVGVEVCTDTYSVEMTATGTYDITETDVSSETTTASTSIGTSISFTTSPFAGYAGDAGDMFLVPSLAIVYSLTTAVSLNTATCAGEAVTSIAWSVDSTAVNSFTWASAWDIENVIIPELEANIVLETDEVKRSLLQNATDGWAQTLADNEANKAAAGLLGVSFDGSTQSQIQFFGGGSELSYTVGTTTTTSTEREVTVEITEEGALELVANVNLAGVVVGTTSTLTFTMTTGNTTVTTDTTETTNEWTFVLSDPDPADEFLVEIRQDPVYGTPVFVTVGGSSSCRMEAGTVGRMVFSALVDPSSVSNVLSTDIASFELQITNESPEEYQIGVRKVLQSDSSPVVTLVGEGELSEDPSLTAIVLPAEQTTTLLLEVQSNLVQFSFEDIEIELMPICEWDLWVAAEATEYFSTSAFFSAYFVEACPIIDWGYGSDDLAALDTCTSGLVVSSSELEAVVFNAELGSFGKWQDNARVEAVQLEYTYDALGFWTTALDADGNAVDLIENDSTGVSRGVWDVSGLADGEYLMRATVVCTDTGVAAVDSTTTVELVVLLDAAAPAVFGTPLPVDQLYWPGDEISITFTETLLCSSYVWSAVVGEAAANCYADFGLRDQTTDYLVSNPVPDGFPSTAISILFWIRAPDDISTTRDIIPFSYAGPDGPFNEVLIVWQAGADVNVFVDNVGYLLSTLAVTPGAWHHFGFTWDSETGDTQVFVDGVLQASFVHQQGGYIEHGGALVIGQEQDSLEGGFASTATMAGLMDELSVWVAALTADEVAAYYASPLLSGTERGLFSAYRFADGEQDAGVVADLNGNMDLTIMGDVAVVCDSGAVPTESTLAMDVACADSTITFAFPFGFDVTTIAGQVVTITVDGATDASGNVQSEAVSWGFVIDDTASYALTELAVTATVAGTARRHGARRQQAPPADFVANFQQQVANTLGISADRVIVNSAVLDSSGNVVVDFVIGASGDLDEPSAAELAPLLETLVFGPDASVPGITPAAGSRPVATLTTSETRPGAAVEEPQESTGSSGSNGRGDVTTVEAVVIAVGTFVFAFVAGAALQRRMVRSERRNVHPAL